MDYKNERDTALALIDFFRSFPLPAHYKKILLEQLSACTFFVEQYDDCFKILFRCEPLVDTFPLYLPTLLQGCQMYKNNGPISCQLFIENGYVTQFEVVDMGLNKIDWDFFWSSSAVFDIDYGQDAIQ